MGLLTDNPQRSKQGINVGFITLVTLAATFLLSADRDSDLTTELMIAAISSTGIAIVIVVYFIRNAPMGMISASTIFLVVFSLFHFGAVALLPILDGLDYQVGRGLSRWILDVDFVIPAIGVALAALVGLAMGARMGWARKRSIKSEQMFLRFEPEARRVAQVTMMLLFVGLLGWIGTLVSGGGLGVLVGPYSQYLDVGQGGILGVAQSALGFAMIFAAALAPSRQRRIIFLGLGVFVMLGLAIGIRGRIMFPGVIAAIIFAKRVGPKPVYNRLSAALLVGVIILSVVAGIRITRQVGLANSVSGAMVLLPQDGLAELGGTLRAVRETLIWRSEGDPLAFGATYWAPWERGFSRFLGSQLPAEQDDRLMNVVVRERVGTIGFSSAAEAYRNFGIFGVGVVHFVIGFFLGIFDYWPTRRLNLLLGGVVMYPLIVHVRNSFTPVPAMWSVALCLVLVMIAISARRPRSRSR